MNFSTLKEQLAQAQLVAVSKKRSVEEIQHFYDLGVRDFGESRVQEALAKMEQLPSDIRWHFIGRLQKNKVAKIVGLFVLIHSVDGPELAYYLSQASEKKDLRQDILLQVNTSGESSKQGLTPEEWKAEYDKVRSFPGIRIRGLMTMAPLDADESTLRQVFSSLRQLKEQLQLTELSMGMSQDYPVAVEQGATLVRIGSALFDG